MEDTFAQVLQGYIERAGMSIQKLARLSEVERTYIHKMMTGDRLPTDRNVVDRICSVLMLTPRQQEHLKRLYLMEKVGVHVYNRHLSVERLLHSFDHPAKESLFKSEYTHHLDVLGDASVAYGQKEINSLIKAIIETEAAQEHGEIRLVAQPQYPWLMDMLVNAATEHPGLTLTHIMCLQRNMNAHSDNRYNLDCVMHIAPLLTSNCNYRPLYYYDDIESHINTTSMFPTLLITSDCVLKISYDIQYATVFRSAEFRKMYAMVFEQCLAVSKTMITPLQTPFEHVLHYIPYQKEEFFWSCSLYKEPCLAVFLTRELMEKYIADSVPEREEILKSPFLRSQNDPEPLKKSNGIISYFSLEGLDSFIKTGRGTEIPSIYYSPLDKADRLFLLRAMYEASLQEAYIPILVDNRNFRFPDNLVISAMSEDAVSLIYVHPVHGSIEFEFCELSVAYAIFEFLTYMKSSDLVLSREETLSAIKGRIDALEAELSATGSALQEEGTTT